MNWDTKINSILTATDCNVATIKDRLNKVQNIPKDPLFDKLNVNRISFDDSPERPWNSCITCVDKIRHSMSPDDMAAISHQLQCQARTIASLNQAVKMMEKEREYQKQRMQSLEEEVQRLQRTSRGTSEAALERRIEDLRRELTSELRSLREQVLEIPDHGVVPRQSSVSSLLEEINESKRTIWKECEGLKREIDQMKQKIRRQEEDVLHQISYSHEAKRGLDRNSKMIEELQDSYRSQTLELHRAKSESQQTQLELQYIKTTVSAIKDEMRKLQVESSVRLPPARKDTRNGNAQSRTIFTSEMTEDVSVKFNLGSVAFVDTEGEEAEGEEAEKEDTENEGPAIEACTPKETERAKKTQSKKSTESSSGEDDSVRKLSLGDISSDDSSFVLDSGKGARQHGFRGLSGTSLEPGIRAESESDPEDYNGGGDLSSDLEGLSDSAPELNFSDL